MSEPAKIPEKAAPSKPSGTHAMAWNIAGNITKVGAQLGIGAALARVLGPEPFGIIAVCWLVAGMGNLIADIGLGPVLVQRDQLEPRLIRFAFTIQVLIGVVLAIALGFAATPIATLAGMTAAADALQWFGLMFVLQALGTVAQNLLKRDLRHREIQLIVIVSYLMSFGGVGLTLALTGFGVWSLVAAQLSQTCVQSMLAYALVRHSVKPAFTAPDMRGLLRVGLPITCTNLVNYPLSVIDVMALSRNFPASVVGFHNRAQVLALTPLNVLLVSVQQVVFPWYARRQQDVTAQHNMLLDSLRCMCLAAGVCFPPLAIACVSVVRVLYGESWVPAAGFLQALAVGAIPTTLMGLCGPLLWGRGQALHELVAQAITLIIAIPIVWWASHISPMAVVWSIPVIAVIRFGLILRALLPVIQLPFKSVIVALIPWLLAMAAGSALAWLANLVLLHWAIPALLIALGVGICHLIGWGSIVWWQRRRLPAMLRRGPLARD